MALLKSCGFEGNTKTGGGFTSLPYSQQDKHSGDGFPGGSLNSEFWGIVFITTGVAKAAGRSPWSVNKFRNNPNRQDSIGAFQQSQKIR